MGQVYPNMRLSDKIKEAKKDYTLLLMVSITGIL